MRTTLDLPDETFWQLKARAALSGSANDVLATVDAPQQQSLPVAIM